MGGSAAMLLAFYLLTAVTVTRDVHRAAPCGPDLSIRVMHRYGDLTLTATDGESLVLHGIVQATAEDRDVAELVADSMIDVLLGTRDETLLVVTRYPRDLEPGPDLSYEVELDLLVPERAFVRADNSFGDLVVEGLQGGCRLESRFGDVELEDTRDCEVSSRYGDVHVYENDGGLVVRSSYGDVFLDDVSDRVRVDNRYGNLEADGVDGVAYLGNRLGRVVARRSAGRLMVVNRFGDVEAWVDDSALTELDVLAELGQVQLNLARRMPWQLGGKTVQGLIRSALPLEVRECNETNEVTGGQGTGGPRIGLIGSWADFYIRTAEPEQDTLDR